ncbi:MAG: branched-chain amino acid ABC transporter permease [candidate division WOR-3 bacterium]
MKLNKILLAFLAIIFLAAFPFLNMPPYITRILILCLLYALLSSSWNILGGYAGLISLGHSSFFGLSAYFVYFLVVYFLFPASIGLFVAAFLSAAICVSLFTPAFKAKLRGPYFILVTILFMDVLRELFTSFREVTGGSFGVTFPYYEFSIEQLQFKQEYFYLYIIVCLYFFFLFLWRRSKRLQLYLKVIRENPDIAESYGVNVVKYIIIAALLSGFFTGIGGSFYMIYFRVIDPATAFGFEMSISLVLMATLGGRGTLVGPLLGAFVLTPISEILRVTLGGTYYGAHCIIYGLLLITSSFFLPGGIYGELNKRLRKK